MVKITNKDYYLPEIFGQLGVMRMDYGTTEPLIIRGVCTKTEQKGDYVTKFRNAPRMSIEASCRELIASFVARELDLFVPDPALIRISPEFVNTLRGQYGYKNASNSIGLNFGCKLYDGFSVFPSNPTFSTKQFEEAKKIYAFDLFILNSDRNHEKQNMLTNGEDILIFDHEKAFGFVFDISGNSNPGELIPNELYWIKNHFLYNYLRQRRDECSFDEFIESLSNLNNIFWKRVDSFIPPEWQTPQNIKIKETLMTIVENRQLFLEQINKTLS